MSILRAESVTKLFGRRTAEAQRKLKSGADLKDVRSLGVTPAVIDATFEVEQGEIFVVMGLSGSGKSTLIRMLNGLLEATSGSVEIDGQDIAKLSPKALRTLRQDKISMVFQHFALFPHRSVLANAAYGLEVRGVAKEERENKAREFLGLVGLEGWEDKLPGQLSGGMQQRVGLARALAAGTDIILMDEAFSALDPLIRREVQDLLLDLQGRFGKTIVFITHDLNEAMRIGDRIAVMREGRIVQIGTAEEILTDPANDYVAQFVADVDRTRVLTASSVMEKPLVTVLASTGPRTALRTMREHQTDAAFVIGRDRRLIGKVKATAVADAVKENVQKLDGLIDPEDLEPVSPDTPVADLFLRCAESDLPVPVADEAGTLLGVIPRVTLLAALGAISSHVEEVVESSGTAGEEPALALTKEGSVDD
ncbi:quaternary amine ABC transporter ATP-binding protein [Actinomadura violacea]|uniref:Glycine betaine/L-proline ABC transporter ATP-binding protein n=1 Tax=Actinomadura violacea TaxID=2819934 RepID=A0ABS3SAP2_9ACTN|nr:glycine betaine/L-proline ABC transporter ATP-binding protein [Actinomadura violacea]MBO2465828.1 glycine betaine/L-proline ABC transporter ATP-binding protein [Actinomadura violacea]